MATMRARGRVHWVGYAWRRWWLLGERRCESLCGLVVLPLDHPAVDATGQSRQVDCIACQRELADHADGLAGDLWVLVDSEGLPVPPLDDVPESIDQGLLVYRELQVARASAWHQSERHPGLGDVQPVRLREWLRAQVRV